METFALAAISLAIAISLIIKKKQNPLHLSYAALCLVLALEKSGLFFYDVSGLFFWKSLYVTGILLIPLFLLVFCRRFLDAQGDILRKLLPYVVLVSCVLGTAFFLLRHNEGFMGGILYLYLYATLLCCSIALVRAASQVEGAEKKRLRYVAVAAVATLIVSLSDPLRDAGIDIPGLSEIALAALVYFILIIITYPKLPELYEIMMRAVIIFILIVFVTVVFYTVIAIFGTNGPFPDFTLVFMASFVIVIFVDPVKLLLKKAAGHFFFEGNATFTSLFAIDEEVEREKSLFLEEMATGLAHEIRNPLASIKGAAQYLKSEVEGSESVELFTVITEEVDRLGNVVSRFLNYAKPCAPAMKPLNVNELVKRTVVLIEQGNLPDAVTIDAFLADDLPPVLIDSEQMIQVFLNIALNGIEAMPQGGMLTFTTGLLRDDGSTTVEVTIADTGVGIRHDKMKRIFEPFYTTREGGTGLGLAISRKIIREHGGYMNVKSKPGQGTSFFIRIPVAPRYAAKNL